jgi:hypothetical protein
VAGASVIALARLRLALRQLVCVLLGHAPSWSSRTPWICERCFREFE